MSLIYLHWPFLERCPCDYIHQWLHFISPLESKPWESQGLWLEDQSCWSQGRGRRLRGHAVNSELSALGLHSCTPKTYVFFFTKKTNFTLNSSILDHFLLSPSCHPCSPTRTPGKWDPSPQSQWHSCAGPWRGQSGVVSRASWGMFGSGLCPFHWLSWAGVFEWQRCRHDPFH